MFFDDESHWPLFRKSQKTPHKPSATISSGLRIGHEQYLQVNQLANNAVCRGIRLAFGYLEMRKDQSRHTTKLSKALNTGMASAITQAITQSASVISTQDPTDSTLR